MRRAAIFAVLAVSVWAGNVHASSTLMRATVTGIVGPNLGTDASGVFASPGTDLLGVPFVVSFTYDLSLGQRTIGAGGTDELIGGPAIGLSDPLIDTTMTILGTTVHMPTAGHMVFSMGYDKFDFYVSSPYPSLVSNQVIMFLSVPGLIPGLDTSVAPRAAIGGELFQIRTDVAIGSGYITLASGQLTAQTLQLAPVPESPIHLMLPAGLLLLGLVSRRHRK